jgi:hypothetical protein
VCFSLGGGPFRQRFDHPALGNRPRPQASSERCSSGRRATSWVMRRSMLLEVRYAGQQFIPCHCQCVALDCESRAIPLQAVIRRG